MAIKDGFIPVMMTDRQMDIAEEAYILVENYSKDSTEMFGVFQLLMTNFLLNHAPSDKWEEIVTSILLSIQANTDGTFHQGTEKKQ